MTADGRFSWEDLDRVAASGYAGLDFSEVLDMADAAVRAPVFDDGTEVSLGDFDPVAFRDRVVMDYLDATAAMSAAVALRSAAEQAAETRQQVLSGMQAVTGVDPESYMAAEAARDDGDGDPLRRIYADYLERS